MIKKSDDYDYGDGDGEAQAHDDVAHPINTFQ